MEDAIIIGLTMALVEVVKKLAAKVCTDETIKQIITPLSVFAIAGALNVGAAYLFAPDLFWREALKQGLTLGAIASGLYGLGKAALGKS